MIIHDSVDAEKEFRKNFPSKVVATKGFATRLCEKLLPFFATLYTPSCGVFSDVKCCGERRKDLYTMYYGVVGGCHQGSGSSVTFGDHLPLGWVPGSPAASNWGH